MDTVTTNFLTFEKIKTLIKSNNFIRYYTLISNIPTDIKKCLKDNIDNINTENFHPKDDFLDRLINTKSLKFVYITLLKTLTHLPIQKFLKWEEILSDWHCRLSLYIFEFLKSVVGIHIWSIFSISFYIELYLLILFYSKFILKTQNCSHFAMLKMKQLNIYFLIVLWYFLSWELSMTVLSPVYTIKVFHQKLCQSFLWQSFLTM